MQGAARSTGDMPPSLTRGMLFALVLTHPPGWAWRRSCCCSSHDGRCAARRQKQARPWRTEGSLPYYAEVVFSEPDNGTEL
jgi:hypothetical protein